MNLNVGCHDIKINGFENLDIDPQMNPDRVVDCTKLKDYYAESSIDFVYCGHFLEHLKFTMSQQIVKDFFYILKNYGCCCCVVPDFMKLPESIEEAESVLLAAGEHKSIFNKERLSKIFVDAGFTVFPIDATRVPWTPFSFVTWQSAIIAIKHVPVSFR